MSGEAPAGPDRPPSRRLLRAVVAPGWPLVWEALVISLVFVLLYVGALLAMRHWGWSPFAPVLVSYGFGATVVYVVFARRWRRRAETWRRNAYGALRELESLRPSLPAPDGRDEPAAPRTFRARVDHLKACFTASAERASPRMRRGRPPRTPTGLTPEAWREKASELRRMREKGVPWKTAAQRVAVSEDTARRWVRWLEEDTSPP